LASRFETGSSGGILNFCAAFVCLLRFAMLDPPKAAHAANGRKASAVPSFDYGVFEVGCQPKADLPTAAKAHTEPNLIDAAGSTNGSYDDSGPVEQPHTLT
jgi:hypothetical protein